MPRIKSLRNKRKVTYICPICIDVIKEADNTNYGHDAIFCEGTCNSCLHHQCAGLSKPNFDLLHNSKVPFYWPHCRLQRYKSQLLDFKSTITQLQNKISKLEIKLLGLSPTDSMNLDTSGPR